MFVNPDVKSDSGWHYHNNVLARIEGGLVRPMITCNADFAEDQIFFISRKRDEWVPTHIRGYARGTLQLFTFQYNKLLEVEDWLEYHSLFDYNSKLGYTLSKKGKRLVEEEGYDYIHFIGEELDEGFLVNPAIQVTNITSFQIKNEQVFKR